MTTRDDLDRLLTVWLDESAGSGAVDYLDETIAGLERLPQRSAWLSPGRWLLMDLTLPRVGVPHVALVLVLIALLVAALLAAVFVGSARPLPAPIGPAATGAFVYDSGGDIWLRSTNGGIRRIPLSEKTQAAGTTFSRDGTRIAYWSTPIGGTAALWITTVDGTDARKVSGDIVGPNGDAAPAADWSPAGDRLTFAAQGRIYVVSNDGTELRPVSTASVAEGPSWSPDGTRIAFKAMADGRPAVFVVGSDGQGEQRVSRREGGELSHNWPSWSPDGAALIYHTLTDGNGDIAVSRLDGTAWAERIVVGGPTNDSWPEWSNDGTHLSFVRSEMTDHGYLVVADPNGQNQRRLVSPLIGWAPHCWAPDDGSIIAVSAERNVAIGEEDEPGFVLVRLAGDAAPELIPTPARKGFAACSWQRLALGD
jgi:Tol biopolymer transport system component